MNTIIAISNQKGGVAKTTTCLSLGAALAEMGHSVLLVDLDPQANLTISLGIKPPGLRHSVVDAILGAQSVVGASRETGVFALDLLPASQELALIDKILYQRPGYQMRLRQALDTTDPALYRYVLLDCPPSLGPLTQNALMASDLLIIPFQCELYATHSLRRTVQQAAQARQQGNPQLVYRVLATMYDMRNKVSRLILAEMQEKLGQSMFKTIIQVDTKLRESPAFGKPVTVYASRSRGATQYRELAQEIASLELIHQPGTEPAEELAVASVTAPHSPPGTAQEQQALEGLTAHSREGHDGRE